MRPTHEIHFTVPELVIGPVFQEWKTTTPEFQDVHFGIQKQSASNPNRSRIQAIFSRVAGVYNENGTELEVGFNLNLWGDEILDLMMVGNLLERKLQSYDGLGLATEVDTGFIVIPEDDETVAHGLIQFTAYLPGKSLTTN